MLPAGREYGLVLGALAQHDCLHVECIQSCLAPQITRLRACHQEAELDIARTDKAVAREPAIVDRLNQLDESVVRHTGQTRHKDCIGPLGHALDQCVIDAVVANFDELLPACHNDTVCRRAQRGYRLGQLSVDEQRNRLGVDEFRDCVEIFPEVLVDNEVTEIGYAGLAVNRSLRQEARIEYEREKGRLRKRLPLGSELTRDESRDEDEIDFRICVRGVERSLNTLLGPGAGEPGNSDVELVFGQCK